MKFYLAALGFALMAQGALAQAIVSSSSGSLNQTIPDDSGAGIASTLSFPAAGEVISVTVDLNLVVASGQTGWFGDLYAYLQHNSGVSVLLNRPGRTASMPGGYDDSQTVS